MSPELQYFPNKTFINGEWADSSSQEQFEVIDPATGKQLGLVPDCRGSEAELAIQAAHDAFQTWSSLTAEVHFFKPHFSLF
jgi:succinate-semialdehyde dehydrogenase/glutarate-semialdehyde dehydrogenase